MKPAPPTTMHSVLAGGALALIRTRLPLGRVALQRRVADQQVPDHRAQALGVGGDVVGEQRAGRSRRRRRAAR